MADTHDIPEFLEKSELEQMGTFSNSFAVLTNGVEMYVNEMVRRLGLDPENYSLAEMNSILVGNRIDKKRWDQKITDDLYDLLEDLRKRRNPSAHGTDYFYKMMMTFDDLLFVSPHVKITIKKSTTPAISKNGNRAGAVHHSAHVINFSANTDEKPNLQQGTLENFDFALEVWATKTYNVNYTAIPGNHEYVVRFVFGRTTDSETFLIRHSFHKDLCTFFDLKGNQNPMIVYFRFDEEHLLQHFIPRWQLPPQKTKKQKMDARNNA